MESHQKFIAHYALAMQTEADVAGELLQEGAQLSY